jgi:septal ring factor EnvC (AmiA/AmiB activator)
MSLIETVTGLVPVASTKAKAAWGFATSTKGKVVIGVVLVAIFLAWVFHRGGERAETRQQPQIEQLKKKLDDANHRLVPACDIDGNQANDANQRADDLASQLAATKTAKSQLEKKVSDYEKQLAKKPGKSGSFVLSPADARSLSNIR